MSLWGNKDQANNAPKFKIKARSPNTGVQLYSTSIVGVHTGDMAVSPAQHPGWAQIKYGMGPLANVSILVGGSGYSNTDTIRVSGTANTTNATATLTTNATGGIVSLAITSNGAKFVNNSTTTLAVANSTGGSSAGFGATFTVVLGGRANRVFMETLVAQTSMYAPALILLDRAGSQMLDRSGTGIVSRV